MGQEVDLMSSSPQGYVTVTEAATRAGVKRETVRRWIQQERLPGTLRQSSGGRQGWRFLIPVGSLEKLEGERAATPEPAEGSADVPAP